MDPALVQGRKCKGDSAKDTITHQDDEDKPLLATKPLLAPIINSKSSKNSQESLLRSRADVLEYQGLCLQYQASILEKQARSMGDNKEGTYYTDNIEYNNHVVEPKDFQHNSSTEHIKSEPEYEAKYVAELETKYNSSKIVYGANRNVDNDGRYKQYDYGSSPMFHSDYKLSKHEDMRFSDYELTVRENGYTPRDTKCTRRDRSSSKRPTELNTNTASYFAPLHVMHTNVPRLAPNKHLEESHIIEEARSESAGPLDLSIKSQLQFVRFTNNYITCLEYSLD